MLNTIIAATDGSEHSNKAIKLASDLSGKYGSKLVVLHVVGNGDVPDELRHMAEIEHLVEPVSTPENVSVLHDQAANIFTKNLSRSNENDARIHAVIGEKIVAGAAQAAKDAGVKDVTTEITNGDAAQQILGCAERAHADMIILGSRGLGDLKGLLQGSVSHKVSQLAPCTCITVK